MNAFKGTLLTAAALAALGLGSAAQANIVDLFSDPNNPANHEVTDTNLGANSCNAIATAAGNGCFMQYNGANIIGGYRDLYVEVVGATDPTDPVRANLNAGNGKLRFSNDTGTTGYGVVQWDGNDNSKDLTLNGMNVDLINQVGCGSSGCNHFAATVLKADAGFEYRITIADLDGDTATLVANTLFDVSPPGETATYQFDWFNLPSAGNPYFLDGLPFDIFHGTFGGSSGAIDFTRIGALQFEINSGTGVADVDLQLGTITKEAPEPGNLALVGMGLFAAGLFGRRARTLKK